MSAGARFALVGWLACGPLASAALAVPCNTPELLGTTPAEGAQGVPTDAALHAFYASSADYLGEEVLLIAPGADPRPVMASFDRAQGVLTIKPPDGLVPGALYAVRWPALRGVDTATPGIGREVQFTVGGGPDAAEPVFDGLTGARWDLQRERNNCTDGIEERLVFDLDLAEANDDGGRGSLALVVFQTAGPQVNEPMQVLVRPMPAAATAVRIGLPASQAVGKICFAALARDLGGKVSASAHREACVQTSEPPFFRGCALGGGGSGGGPIALLVALALGALSLRGREN